MPQNDKKSATELGLSIWPDIRERFIGRARSFRELFGLFTLRHASKAYKEQQRMSLSTYMSDPGTASSRMSSL